MNLNISSCWNILCLDLGLFLEISLGLWTFPVHLICSFFYTLYFLENIFENSNTPEYTYPHQLSVITIQVDQCWLWSVWLGWLLNYFFRSESNFGISQILHNQILISVWDSKNYSSDIIIMGEAHYFTLQQGCSESPMQLYLSQWVISHPYFSGVNFIINPSLL